MALSTLAICGVQRVQGRGAGQRAHVGTAWPRGRAQHAALGQRGGLMQAVLCLSSSVSPPLQLDSCAATC